MQRLAAACLAVFAGTATAEVPRVATDIAPVQSLVAQVMGDLGTPDMVIQHGASPHIHRLRPSEATALAAADLVFWVSDELTPWMPDAIGTLGQDTISVELIATKGTNVLAFREQAIFLDHDDDHDHAHHGFDPHAWLDPANAKIWLGVIASRLAVADPANAADYRANANAGAAALDKVSAEIEAKLARHQEARFIVFHDAYQYFESRFGLSAAGAIAFSDAANPSPARIAAIRRHVSDEGIACVFAEPQFNARLVDTVLQGTSAATAVIDPLGASITPGPDFYGNLLIQISDRISGCLDGQV